MSEIQSLQRTKFDSDLLAPDADEQQGTGSRDNRRVNVRMNNFLDAYRKCFGNISGACLMSGVSRPSYYRWIDPKTTNKLYKRFQKQLFKIRPEDLKKDAAEGVVMHHVGKMNLIAAMFMLNNIGLDRGYGDKRNAQVNTQSQTAAAISAVRSYQLWLSDNPNASETEKAAWLARFAHVNGAPEADVIRTMKIQELTASVQ